MKVCVDTNKCIGSGQCVLATPAVFSQREDDGIVVLLKREPPAELAAAVRKAAALCPSRAITIEEDDSGR